jgi:hypothetical protein
MAFSAPRRTKPLNRSMQKFERLIMSAGPPSRPKFIMICRGVAAPHIGAIYGWRSFFLVTSRANAQPTPSARSPHIIHQSTRFWPRKCLWESHRYVSSLGGVIPENPSFWGRQWGIPSLNVYGLISAQEKRMTTLDILKCASRRDTQCAVVKTEGWGHCRGQTYKSLFQGQIYS